VLSGLRWSEEGGDRDLALGGFGHMCEIWGYHGFVAEDIGRLECEAELLGKYFPTFRKVPYFQVRTVQLHFHIFLGSVKALNFVISYTPVNFFKVLPDVSKDTSFSGLSCPASLSYISGFSESSEFCDQLHVCYFFKKGCAHT
jgi:hypothetical protein